MGCLELNRFRVRSLTLPSPPTIEDARWRRGDKISFALVELCAVVAFLTQYSEVVKESFTDRY